MHRLQMCHGQQHMLEPNSNTFCQRQAAAVILMKLGLVKNPPK